MNLFHSPNGIFPPILDIKQFYVYKYLRKTPLTRTHIMTAKQLTLSIESPASDWLKRELADFNAFGKNTIVTSTETEPDSP